MKIYLAGKITGDPDYKRKFSAVEGVLRDYGHIVINPAILPEGLRPKEYMRICFSMIDAADIVAFIPDWDSSTGAKLECDYCEYTGKRTFFLDGTAEWKKASRVIEQKATQRKHCCLNCSNSMSADTITGEHVLVCEDPEGVVRSVAEDYCCERHTDLESESEVAE